MLRPIIAPKINALQNVAVRPYDVGAVLFHLLPPIQTETAIQVPVRPVPNRSYQPPAGWRATPCGRAWASHWWASGLTASETVPLCAARRAEAIRPGPFFLSARFQM